MKRCLECGETFVSSEWSCPFCGFGPDQHFPYLAFAPKLIRQHGGFNAETHDQYALIEDTHFWFQSRNRLIGYLFETYFSSAQKLLEVGCGTGAVLMALSERFPHLSLTGTELLMNGLDHAASRVKNADFLQMDALAIPFENEFDVVGAFDVLEHIEQDDKALTQLYQACKPGGGIILTVPQHPFLWSVTDEYACHKRRYTRQDLLKKVEEAGFTVVRSGSFVSLLLPLMAISRVFQWKRSCNKKEDSIVDSHAPIDEGFKINPYLNRTLGLIMDFERFAIKKKAIFPAGGSLFLVGKKEMTENSHPSRLVCPSYINESEISTMNKTLM